MDRTERQKLSIKRWIDSGGRSVIQAATGYGKTRCAITLVRAFLKRNPNLVVLVAVPTEVLKEQWIRELAKNQLFSVCKVEIFNTIIKNTYLVDLLIVDECHLSASESFLHMYEQVSYKYLLGLTATWERLDGREKYLEKYMSICDTITLNDALKNGWVSQFRNYKVLLDVDLSEYYELNRKFQSIFSIFSHDFKLIMSLVKNPRKAKIWAKNNGYDEKKIRGFLASFMRLLKQRKDFVMSHKKKFEVANKILDARLNKKTVLFTATVKDAELFKNRGYICHSQRKKNENRKIVEEFNNINTGLIVSPRTLIQGVDIKGLSVGIALTCNSSQITCLQSRGRVIRFEEGKVAEFFTLVIANSVEEVWFNNSNRNQQYITITEKQLDTVLSTGEISTRPKKGIVDIENRF